MRVIRQLADLASLNRPVHLAIGVFDGVHRGHQQVIGQARDAARASSGAAVVLSFDPHPQRVLHPDKAPPLLTATVHKLALIDQLAVDAVLLLHFTRELSQLPAKEFLTQLAAPGNQLRQICVGTRFHFGHDRAGNVRLMEKLAPALGYVVKEIPAVHTADGEMISSSAIRQHVQRGHLERAALMLGRPYSLLGTVVAGDQRGRSIGFPTANLNPHNEVLPPDGVYAARVQAGNENLSGVVNIGLRPTFQHATPGRLIEVHILDLDRDLYGQEIEVELIQKLRGEQKFPSAEALVQQIRADIAATRQLLSK